MRYIVIIIATFLIIAIAEVYTPSEEEGTIIPASYVEDDPVSEWDEFIDVVIYVESRGNDSAIGDNGKAVGCLQIHPIAVLEANRILAKYDSPTVYSLGDRYNREKSIEMFNVISEEYECCEDYTFMEYAEIVARRWNGGPRGDRKIATIKYWNKIKNEYTLR
jgi:hypothetical protein